MASSSIGSVALRLYASDNVVIARSDISKGTKLSAESVSTCQNIRAGHKIAVKDIAVDEPVYRYGQIIGFASRSIAAGEHVHIHNMRRGEFERDYAFYVDAKPTEFVMDPATFNGYLRVDDRAATRNYIGVISSVNCSATAAHHIANHFRFSGELDAYPNIDGAVAITHDSGCGMADGGLGFDTLKRVLQGYSSHANFGAIVMIGLGCEVMQLGSLLHGDGIKPSGRLHSVTIQQAGGTRKAIDHVVGKIRELLPEVNRVQRQPISAAELCVALQCSGSDSYSGVTANPALGATVDRLVQHSGKIGGAAQARRGGAVLHDVTMAYDMDANKMLQVLRIGREKMSDKGTKSAAKRVDPLRSQTGLPRNEIIDCMVGTFRDNHGLNDGELTTDELSAMEDMIRERFATEEWRTKVA